MKKSMEGSECPILDMQATSMIHTDRYKGVGQTKESPKNGRKKEIIKENKR